MSSFKDNKTNDYKPTEITSWCRYIRAQQLRSPEGGGYNIVGIKMCRDGERNCHNAHHAKQFTIPSHIRAWDEMDKTNVDLLEIRNNILDVISMGKDYIVNPKYSSLVHNVNKMNFVELLAFWYDLACHHRKLAKSKDIPSKRSYKGSVKPDLVHGYHFIEDIPKFNLMNEDIVWALERSCHTCEVHENTINNHDKQHTFFSICCGDDHTCKTGEHDINKVACTESLMTGKCSCLTMEEIETEKIRINSILYGHDTTFETEKLRIETMLSSYNKPEETSANSDGWSQVKLSKVQKMEQDKALNSLRKELDKLYIAKDQSQSKLRQELRGLVRKIHYSDKGLISLAQRISDAEAAKVVAKVVDVTKIEIKAPGVKIVKKKY